VIPHKFYLCLFHLPNRGRFAPTPSGPLHMGSLLTALASFLQARSQGGRWLLRIDDLDGPRCHRVRPTPSCDSWKLMNCNGMKRFADNSECLPEYEQALNILRESGNLYPCICTRAQLEISAALGPDGPVYPGTCRAAERSERTCKLALSPTWRGLFRGWLAGHSAPQAGVRSRRLCRAPRRRVDRLSTRLCGR